MGKGGMMKYCIDNSSTDVFFYLAAEEYLLKYSADDVFILWQDTPSVVLGKHQSVRAEVNSEWVNQNQIHIARRFSGGGTVYHDLGNLNLTFIETASRIPDFTTYMSRIVDFLLSVGLPAEGDERLGIYLNGLKISGSAQCVHKNRILYHCTLLYDTDLSTLNKVLDSESNTGDLPVSANAVPSVRSEVTNIGYYLQGKTIDQFKTMLFQYLSTGYTSRDFELEELKAIDRLRNEKYIQKEWVFNR